MKTIQERKFKYRNSAKGKATEAAYLARPEVRARMRERDRINYRKRVEHHKTRKLKGYYKRRYGLTLDERAAFLSRGGGLCEICKEAPATFIDHCHKTGVVRGALCLRCNSAIGHMRERTDILQSAIRYLETFTES